MRFLREAARPAALVIASAALAPVYTRLAAQSVINSDGANEALQGLDFWHGNLLLHGWWLAQDTFYLTDAPLYGLIARLQGLGPAVVHEAAALVYALGVLVAAALARRGAPLTAAVLALPAPLLLQGQMHILGTAYALGALLLLEHGPRRIWAQAVAAALLVASFTSDPFMALLFAPAFAIPALRRRDLVPPLLVAVAAIATVALPALVQSQGGFQRPRALGVGLAPPAETFSNLKLLLRGLLFVFHADVRDAPGDAVTWLRLPALAIVAAALWWGLRRLRAGAPDAFVPQVLLLACLLDLAAFLFSTQPIDLDSSRFLSPFAFCAAALAGRALNAHAGQRPVRAGAALAVVALVVALPIQLARPSVRPPTATLESWLEAKGLRAGVGAYWESSIVTLDTGGRITVRSIDGGPPAAPYRWFQKSSWFTPGSARPANFVVLAPDDPRSRIDQAEAETDFGAPVEIDHIGPYEVMVYSRDLLPMLAP